MPIINPTELQKMTAGDDDLVADLAIMFVKYLPGLKALIRIGIESGDTEAVESGAHQLKSNVAYFGATTLRDQCGQIETAARNGQQDELLELNDRLFADVDELLQELRTLTNLALEIDTD